MQQNEDAFNTSSEGSQRQRHPRGVHRVKGTSHTLMKIVLGCSSIGRGEGEQTSSDMLQTSSLYFHAHILGIANHAKKIAPTPSLTWRLTVSSLTMRPTCSSERSGVRSSVTPLGCKMSTRLPVSPVLKRTGISN